VKSRWHRRAAATAFVALASLSAGSSRADEDPRIAKSKAIFAEGSKLAGDHRESEALQKFVDAYGVYPSPNILAAIGRQRQVLGQQLEAIRDLRAALRDPLLNPENTERVKTHIREAEAKLGRLGIEGPPGARVVVDGHDYVLPLAAPIDVNPGSYRAQVSFSGKSVDLTGTAPAGVVTTAKAAFDDGHVIEPPVEPRDERRSTASYVGLGVSVSGLAAIGAGVGFLVAKGGSSSDVSDLEAATASRGDPCGAGSTSQACRDLEDKRAERDRNGGVGTALLIGGSVLAVTGAVMFFALPKTSTKESVSRMVTPLAGPGFGGIRLRFEY